VPRLRFTRDERGYEHTFLVHTSGRRGRERSRVLYWYRSPPAVRVGRPALDAAAIRAIEEANPAIVFDWPTILEARPGGVEPVEAWRTRRAKPSREPEARESQPPEIVTAPDAPPQHRGPEEGNERQPPGDSAPPLPAGTFETHAPENAEDSQPIAQAAVHRALGAEGLVRVRARYAEVLARISSQVTDAAIADELRVLAEHLNPDAWVTDEEVRRGLERFEPVLETLRQRLGRPRRRRAQPNPDELSSAVSGNAVDSPSGPVATHRNPHSPAD
jgi:hypothetical protein